MIRFQVRLERAAMAQCSSCGHGVTLSAQNRLTQEDYGSSLRVKAQFEREYLPARWRSYERGLAAIASDVNGKLLDFGANYGHFVAFALDRGWDAVGYEPGAGPREFAVEPAGSRLAGSLAEAAEHAPFDVITFWDVLEHLDAPKRALKGAQTLLKSDGRIIIRVPDATVFQAVKRRGRVVWGPLYLKLCHPTNPEEHFHHFTPQSLTLMGHAAGFVPEQLIKAAADERVAAGRTIVDGALRKLLHRVGQRLPYEFTLIFSRSQ
jgi:SAM-dependent methyltransferase